MSPPPGIGASSLGSSAIIASVVIIRPAMLAAFCTRYGFIQPLFWLRQCRNLILACAGRRVTATAYWFSRTSQ